MARVNKLLNIPITSIVKDNEVEKFLSLDKTLDINSVDELQVYESLYSDIYEGIKSQLYDLSKIEQLIVQLRCQKVIMKEIHIFVSQVYVYARATFYRDDKDIKDIRVLIGPVSVLGTDMDVLLNNSMFMEDAYCKLFVAMNNEIENNLPAVEVLQINIRMTHIEQLTQLRHDLIQECLNYFTLKQITLIKFKTPFIITIAEDNSFNDDSSLNDYKAQYLTSDGELTGEGLDTFEYGSTWNLNDMELMDIAYTLDQLEAGNYTEEEEIFLDENDQIGN